MAKQFFLTPFLNWELRQKPQLSDSLKQRENRVDVIAMMSQPCFDQGIGRLTFMSHLHLSQCLICSSSSLSWGHTVLCRATGCLPWLPQTRLFQGKIKEKQKDLYQNLKTLSVGSGWVGLRCYCICLLWFLAHRSNTVPQQHREWWSLLWWFSEVLRSSTP